MDENKPEDESRERPGPLTRLIEDELAPPSERTYIEEERAVDRTDVEQIRHRQTRVEPTTPDMDYAKGTSEHDDDREG
jgi:hypothetical protein